MCEAIITKLSELFAPLDAEILSNTQKWAKGRAQALRQFKQSDDYETVRRCGQEALYARYFAICGGKSWYNAINYSTPEQLEAFVTKNHEATIKSRNDRIADKTTKAGVTEVVSSEFAHSYDGFNGVFIVNTNTGRKAVTVSSVYAGGYNIQCLHLRVLVKVK